MIIPTHDPPDDEKGDMNCDLGSIEEGEAESEIGEGENVICILKLMSPEIVVPSFATIEKRCSDAWLAASCVHVVWFGGELPWNGRNGHLMSRLRERGGQNFVRDKKSNRDIRTNQKLDCSHCPAIH